MNFAPPRACVVVCVLFFGAPWFGRRVLPRFAFRWAFAGLPFFWFLPLCASYALALPHNLSCGRPLILLASFLSFLSLDLPVSTLSYLALAFRHLFCFSLARCAFLLPRVVPPRAIRFLFLAPFCARSWFHWHLLCLVLGFAYHTSSVASLEPLFALCAPWGVLRGSRPLLSFGAGLSGFFSPFLLFLLFANPARPLFSFPLFCPSASFLPFRLPFRETWALSSCPRVPEAFSFFSFPFTFLPFNTSGSIQGECGLIAFACIAPQSNLVRCIFCSDAKSCIARPGPSAFSLLFSFLLASLSFPALLPVWLGFGPVPIAGYLLSLCCCRLSVSVLCFVSRSFLSTCLCRKNHLFFFLPLFLFVLSLTLLFLPPRSPCMPLFLFPFFVGFSCVFPSLRQVDCLVLVIVFTSTSEALGCFRRPFAALVLSLLGGVCACASCLSYTFFVLVLFVLGCRFLVPVLFLAVYCRFVSALVLRSWRPLSSPGGYSRLHPGQHVSRSQALLPLLLAPPFFPLARACSDTGCLRPLWWWIFLLFFVGRARLALLVPHQ